MQHLGDRMDGNNQKVKIVVLALAALVVLGAIDWAAGKTAGTKGVTVISAVEAAEMNVLADKKVETIATTRTFETVQGALLEVCEARGYGEDCAKTLLGMLWKESLNDPKAVGDGGKARGYFQIHYRLHRISIDCAEDLTCSANWTLDYMESNGYPRHVAHAVQCHNGCNIANGYWQSALRWGNRKWNTPLFLDSNMAEVAIK